MPTDRRTELMDLRDALEDEPIGPEDRRYFDFHVAPGDPRGDDPIRSLETTIGMARSRETCQLFSGFRGSGKSSELRRLAASLQARHKIVFVEGARYVNLHKALEPADLLVSVAAAVAQFVKDSGAGDPAHQGLLTRIAEFFSGTDVSPAQIGLGTDPVKLTFNLARNPSFKAQVQDALRGRVDVLVQQFRAFMAQAKATLGLKAADLPVLVVDDLEKVSGTGPEQAQVQKGIEQIFWEFNWMLTIEGWHTLWTAPPYIQLLNPDIHKQYDCAAMLPMIRLWDQEPQRNQDDFGLKAMRGCLRKRGDVGSLFFRSESLDQVIMASSGRLRDLLALMKNLVARAFQQKDPSAPLPEHVVEREIASYEQDFRTALYGEDEAWLKQVARTRVLRAPEERFIPRAAKLLDTGFVLTYHNSHRWVDVHAAIRKVVDPPEQP